MKTKKFWVTLKDGYGNKVCGADEVRVQCDFYRPEEGIYEVLCALLGMYDEERVHEDYKYFQDYFWAIDRIMSGFYFLKNYNCRVYFFQHPYDFSIDFE